MQHHKPAATLPQLPAWGALPAPLRERLELEGVSSASDWAQLGKRRFTVWGVTRRTVRMLDAIARNAS